MKCRICGEETMFDVNGLCFVCYEQTENERIAKMYQDDELTESIDESDVVCPYCGLRTHDDEGEFIMKGEGEARCYRCGKVFRFYVEEVAYYSTERIEEEQDD